MAVAAPLMFGSLSEGFRSALGVLEELNKHQILPTPEAYELWLVHKRGLAPELSAQLNGLIEGGVPITIGMIGQMRAEYLEESTEAAALEERSDGIITLSDDFGDLLHDMRGQMARGRLVVTSLGDTLTDAIEELKRGGDREQCSRVIAKLAGQMTAMHDHVRGSDQELSASVIRVEQLRQALSEQQRSTSVDTLTGIGNRRGLELKIKRILGKLQSGGEQRASFMLLDVDHFRRSSNDYGDKFGATVLRLVGRLLVDSIKGRDYAARTEGEQFGVLLIGADLDAGSMVARQIGASLATKQVRLANSVEKGYGRVTASIGIVELLAEDSVASVLERAGVALHAAIRGGRNRVVTERDPCIA